MEKIQPKQPAQFPPQLNNMMEFAIAAIPQVSGVPMELMGQSRTDAPQVALLESGRREQAMNVLAALFNAKRRYHKEQGRLLLWMIQEYIADGRLIRIGGPEQRQFVPLVHEPGLAEYDVIVDDAPTSPNMKDKVWTALMGLFPMLRGMPIPPQFYIEALQYSPVPASFAQKASQILSQPPPVPPGMQAKEAVDHARAGLFQAQAQKAGAEAQRTHIEAALMPHQAGSEVTERDCQDRRHAGQCRSGLAQGRRHRRRHAVSANHGGRRCSAARPWRRVEPCRGYGASGHRPRWRWARTVATGRPATAADTDATATIRRHPVGAFRCRAVPGPFAQGAGAFPMSQTITVPKGLDKMSAEEQRMIHSMRADDAALPDPAPTPSPEPAARRTAPDPAATPDPAAASQVADAPAPAAEDDDDDDVAPPSGEGPQAVPHKVFHAERERRKATEARLAELEKDFAAKQARQDERLNLLIAAAQASAPPPVAAPPEEPLPDVAVDPVGHSAPSRNDRPSRSRPLAASCRA